MLDALRSDLRASVHPALNQAVRTLHVAALNAAQDELAVSYDWPELRAYADVRLKSGERFYDLPSLPSERDGDAPEPIRLADVQGVFVRYCAEWYRLERGITPLLYDELDSEREEKCGVTNGRRPTRWDIHGARQFEIWPVPSEQCTKIQFRCLRPRRPLINDDDTPSIDGRLVALTAARNLCNEDNLRKQLQERLNKYEYRQRARQSSGEGFPLHKPQRPVTGINIRFIRG